MRSQSRAGFTLIELMVAMALTMFLMIILTQCFVLSLETFAGMKGLGDMQQNMRTATTLLASDLAEDHFEGKRRLSDPNIFTAANPIQAGYFAINQGSPSVFEGFDGYTYPSSHATNHVLAFTVKRKGNRAENFFTAALHANNAVPLTQFFYPLGAGNNSRSTAYNMLSQPSSPFGAPPFAGYPPPVLPKNYVAPPARLRTPTPDVPSVTSTSAYTGGNLGFYSSQWADVYYYLVATGTTEQPNNPAAATAPTVLGTPIYSLYRAQFVMVPDSTVVNGANINAVDLNPNVTNPLPFQGLSTCVFSANPTVLFNSPIDAANRTVNKLIRRTIDVNPVTNPTLAFPIDYPPPLTMDRRLVPNLGAASGKTGTGTSENNAGLQTQGSTELVLPNVISFQVQIIPTIDTWTGAVAYAPGNTVRHNGINYVCIKGNNNPPPNPNFWVVTAFIDVPQVGNSTGTPGYYDSSLLNQAGAGFSIKAIRVTLRVWDNATRQTRQASITQDL